MKSRIANPPTWLGAVLWDWSALCSRLLWVRRRSDPSRRTDPKEIPSELMRLDARWAI